jgi:uncharacterized UBP type Zn finger protein
MLSVYFKIILFVHRVTADKANLWLCLYPDCYMLGCAEGLPDHSTQHNRDQPDHCIQLNIVSWRAWCYSCKTEVILTRNNPPVRGIFGTADHNSVAGQKVKEDLTLLFAITVPSIIELLAFFSSY